MPLKRIAAVMLRYFYIMRGSPARVLPLFAWAAIDIVLWGFITKYLNQVSSGGFSFVPLLLGSVLLWDFFGRVMYGVTTAFFEDVWSRNFLNLFASPLSFAEYLAALVAASLVTSMLGLIVMLVLAGAAFDLSLLVYGSMLLPFLLLLLLFGIALGIAGSAMVLRFGPAAEWFIWPLPALLAPFAGVFYPISTLPPWMQFVSHFLPPAYVFEGMRGILLGQGFSAASLFAAAGMSAVYVLLAFLYFFHVYRYALRTGLIPRYSAETTG